MAQYSIHSNKFLDNNKSLYEVMLTGGGASVYTPAGNLDNSIDAFGRTRVSNPHKLFSSSLRYSDSERRWNEKLTGTSSSSHNNNQSLIEMTVGSSNGDSIIRETDRVFPYQAGKSLQILNSFTFSEAKENLRQRVGYFGKFNGIYLEKDGLDTYIVKRSYGTGSVVNTRVAQSDWNVDSMDGSGPSGINLDLTKSHILFIDIEWLGVGSVRAGFVINGQFVLAHIFHHANSIDGTYMTTATLPIRYEITNTGDTSGSSTMKQICSTVTSEGGYNDINLTRSASNPITGKNLTNGIDNPMVSIRLRSQRTDAVAVPRELTLYGLQDTAFKYKVIRNGTLNGASWDLVDSVSSVEYDLSADSMSNGTVIFEGLFKGQSTVDPIDLHNLFDHTAQLTRGIIDSDSAGDIFTIAIEPTTNNDDAVVALSWQEATA